VSLALRIAYGISGVVGEDEVAYQFQEPPAVSGESLAVAMADVPDDMQQRLYDAYGDAANVRPGQVNAAAVRMSVAGQSRERVEEYIGSIEAANREARAAAQDTDVEDAEVVPDDDESPPADTQVDSLRAQIAVLEARQIEIEENPGDFAETSLELDQITSDIEHLEGLITAAEQAGQGTLL
jgi:hypothetical protein